jgi:hypothetical protein
MEKRELAFLKTVGIVEELSEDPFFVRSQSFAENSCPGCVKGTPGAHELNEISKRERERLRIRMIFNGSVGFDGKKKLAHLNLIVIYSALTIQK